MGRRGGPQFSPDSVAGWFGPPGEPRRHATGFLFFRPLWATIAGLKWKMANFR